MTPVDKYVQLSNIRTAEYFLDLRGEYSATGCNGGHLPT